MRFVTVPTVSSVLLFAALTSGAWRLASGPLGSGATGGGGQYDQSKISCSGRAPNRVCKLRLETLKREGGKCRFNDDGTSGDAVGESDHLPFALSISQAERLMILPEQGKNKPVRFRELKLVGGPPNCPTRPFVHGQVMNHFGEDMTGPPVDFKGVQGCQYKMSVQTNEEVDDEDDDHPGDPQYEGRKFFCIDPHFVMN